MVINTAILPNEPSRFTGAHLDLLLLHCESLPASDITLQTGEFVYAEVYGRLLRVTQHRLANSEVGDLLNTIYGQNGTAIIMSGKDIDTHYEFKPSRSERYRYRINGTGCQVEGHDALQLTIRSIPTTPPPLENLALPETLLTALEPSQGVIYVTGATGSGKSTLLASIIRHIAEQTESNRKILTYEAPIEFIYDAIDKPSSLVSQSEVPRHLPSFAAGVRNALRRKPMLIMVGEARDQETIAAVIEAALTGHPVYTTLHANGVAETMRRLITSFPNEERYGRAVDILETIRVAIWQKLVPSVDGKRVALREYLVFDEQIRDNLLEADPNNITAATRTLLKTHGQVMLVDAKRHFEAGTISERTYKLLVATDLRADQDAGLG